MFQNKEEFIKDYEAGMIANYGRSVAQSHPTEQYYLLAEMVKNSVGVNWKNTKDAVSDSQGKQLYYFSMEFLLGKMLKNNLMNLGIYDIVKDGLGALGIKLTDLEKMETDAGLGNGGLGRLAACFMDSLASLNLPGNGNCIRYEYGLFKQKIVNNKQVEVPDKWLKYGNPWEVRKPKHAVDVRFWGRIDMNTVHGRTIVSHVDAEIVRAVPYDIPMIGYDTKTTNTLRLWSAEASEDIEEKDFRTYIQEVNEICQNVYPDDSTEHGRILRLKQEYFFVSAGVQTALKTHMDTYHTLDNLPDKVVFQLNDTHPTMLIPELMRILMDDYEYSWDHAWQIVKKCVAYTNHTVMAEALEHWPIEYFQKLLPRIYMIIEEINRRFNRYVLSHFHDEDLMKRVSIIRDGQVYMANLCIVAGYSVNGVAALHSEILKNDVFKDYYRIYPSKFNNKTNGITHRRWLLYSNPELATMLKKYIGDSFITQPQDLVKLMDHLDDPQLIKDFAAVKHTRKLILADYLLENTGVAVDPNSIFDGMAKRLHAYKRQLLNVLHIIYLYQEFKRDPQFKIYPRTFIFAAKAAPAYTFAKQVIELINCVAKVINHDPEVSKYIKVVFIPNYSVSVSEVLMNGSDVSEQISTAGKEASGTGNMKFMMNGAITLGTYDGANVEIDQLVGQDNDVIFGLRVEDIKKLKNEGYDAEEYYNSDPKLKQVIDSLIDGTFSPDLNEFKLIYDELLYRNDEYFVLADFEAYREAQKKIEEKYQNQTAWYRSCLVNIAQSGYFSSDRTINDYNKDIWHLEPIKVK